MRKSDIKAHTKFRKNNMSRFEIQLHNINDAKYIEVLEAQDNRTQFIRDLIDKYLDNK